MEFKKLTEKDYKTIPWKNGKGTTQELWIYPETATVEDFDIRMSIADVVASGNFSIFKGIHRTIVQLTGSEMTLNHLEPLRPKMVLEKFRPYSFEGSDRIFCRLKDFINHSSKTTDFNVMTKKSKFSHKVELLDVKQTQMVKIACESYNFIFIYILSGGCSMALDQSIVETQIYESLLIKSTSRNKAKIALQPAQSCTLLVVTISHKV